MRGFQFCPSVVRSEEQFHILYDIQLHVTFLLYYFHWQFVSLPQCLVWYLSHGKNYPCSLISSLLQVDARDLSVCFLQLIFEVRYPYAVHIVSGYTFFFIAMHANLLRPFS